jgi:signal transduction histidine kinase
MIPFNRFSLSKTGGMGDVAFTVVVSFSYLAMISAAFPILTLTMLVVLMILGTLYILMGIYGYSYVAKKGTRGWALAYFCVQIPLSGLIVALGRGAGFNALLMLPLAGQAGVILHRRGMLTASIAILLAYVGAVGYYSGGLTNLWNGLTSFLAGLVFVDVFTQLTVDQEKSMREVERLAHELEQANQQLREYSIQAEELAITQERNRLAREIHDGLGHYLTTVHMQIQAAQAVMDKDRGRAMGALEKARSLTQSALVDVRQSVATLRSSPHENRPLPELVTALLDDVRSSDLKVDLKILGTPRQMPPPVELTCFRTAQESLNNVRKHAHASCVSVKMDYTMKDKFRLSVIDDGVGTNDPHGGFGLLGLRERVHLVDGEINLVTAPGEGFNLTIEVPG